jgi:acetyl esterase/lipase
MVTFAVSSDRDSEAVYFLNRVTGELKVLAESSVGTYREHLAPMEPVTFPARDGLTIHGLLTVPPGATGPHPMVLLVHGGPWARDRWSYDATVQFLANRGYAVLQVNYRGSTEFGRDFLLAGTREFGRKMHDDLIDGVRWAVARGIADEKRVAIMGGSYGGYATLSGLAFTPDVFAAGVDRVGIADMVSLIEDWPRYWRTGDMGFWSRFFGDPRKPEERAALAERSPLACRRDPRAAPGHPGRQRRARTARPFRPHRRGPARAQSRRRVHPVRRRRPRHQSHAEPGELHPRRRAFPRPPPRRSRRRRASGRFCARGRAECRQSRPVTDSFATQLYAFRRADIRYRACLKRLSREMPWRTHAPFVRCCADPVEAERRSDASRIQDELRWPMSCGRRLGCGREP